MSAKMNFSGAQITQSPMTIGDNNQVINGCNTLNIEWSVLEKDIQSTLCHLPKQSNEYQATEELLNQVQKRETSKIKQLIKENISSFFTAVFTTAASEYLIRFLTNMMQ